MYQNLPILIRNCLITLLIKRRLYLIVNYPRNNEKVSIEI